MRQTKNSKEVQGTGIAKQEQFNIANQNLFSYFGYSDLKENYNNLFIGWVSSDFIETDSKEFRIEILDFYLKTLSFIEKAEIDYISQNKEIPLILYKEILLAYSDQNFNKIKKYFNKMLISFSQSEIANKKEIRDDVFYSLRIVKRYFKAVCKIFANNKTNNCKN